MCGGAYVEWRNEVKKEPKFDGVMLPPGAMVKANPDDALAFLRDQMVTCGGCGSPVRESEIKDCPGETCPRYKKLNAGYTGNLHILGNRSTNPLPPVGE